MFSAAPAGPPSSFPRHERHTSDHIHPVAPPGRPVMELPRPLEPRPSYQQSALPAQVGNDRRADGYREPAPVQPEFRPQTQSLPRLHDILTSGSPAPGASHYGGGWGASAPPPLSRSPAGEGYYSHAGWHPPLAHPREAPPQYHPPQPVRRLELPILETSPVARHDSHSMPLSPYARYHDREYADPRHDRSRQPSSSSYLHNGMPSPYASAGADDYRTPAATLERPPSGAFGPAGPESSKKYLGIREVPGEGSFHMYEGGFRIPTHVDGETVNPAWGLTKANKPRKRLAMACLDCREKKIKCEPGPVSCLQCEKAKRICRKAPAHQSQSDSGGTPVWQSNAESPPRKGHSDPTPYGRDGEPDSANKRRTTEDASPSGVPTKKHRSVSPFANMNGATAPAADTPHQQVSPILPRSPGKMLSWEEDPYAVEPETTLHLLDYFFARVNDAAYSFFPRNHFMRWVVQYPQKCQNERLLLYAVLAIASVFVDDRYSGFGKHCANIATEALHNRQGRFSLPVTQARMLLGMYHFAKGSNSAAWEYIGSAINAAMYLRYHTESGCTEMEDVEKARNEFAFTTEQLAECRRRTLWSAFLMGRMFGAPHGLINPQDIFVRLPCMEDSYERGLASEAPYYNNGINDPVNAILTASSAISAMAWLVLIGAIWGDVANFTYRAVHRSPRTYEEEYEKFYEDTQTALQGWESRLPEQLRFNQTNVERCLQADHAGPFISMHVLYHLSWLKMSRFVRYEYIQRSIARNVRATYHHAHELLRVISVFRTAQEQAAKEGHPTFAFATPFVGYAILAAIDVVGAGGLDSNLKSTLDVINDGLICLRELGRYWNSARDQDRACEKRYYQIQNVLKHPFTARSGCWLGREWGVHSASSLEREFSLENDCIYGVSDRVYFDALKEHAAAADARPSSGSLRIA